MSTFEDKKYQWRETYFVLFSKEHRPDIEAVRARIQSISTHFELRNVRADEVNGLISLTVASADDFSALDVSYLEGEEVLEQVATLSEQMKQQSPDSETAQQMRILANCDARFDVLHFEQLEAMAEEEEDDLLDPGSLLLVMDGLIELCQGVGIDPQTESFY